MLGLGNWILTDDRIGLLVAREVAGALRWDARWNETASGGGTGSGFPVVFHRQTELSVLTVVVDEESAGGLRLMERMIGFDRVILIDAIYPAQSPGTVHKLGIWDLPTQRTAGTHDMHLATALQLGRFAGYQLPNDEDVVIVGIEAAEVFTFGEECTLAVAAACRPAARLVLQLLDQIGCLGREKSADESSQKPDEEHSSRG